MQVGYRGKFPAWIEIDSGSGPQRYEGPIQGFSLNRKSGVVDVQKASSSSFQQQSIGIQQGLRNPSAMQYAQLIEADLTDPNKDYTREEILQRIARLTEMNEQLEREIAAFRAGYRPNPAPKKKVNKAKEAYKKFHGGKSPKEVKTETIDVGEVWYGLGPCWSIGYMSPKETGDDGQKYIHHTNEDSKDGNYPMMYATMPENGEPMIVIKGGSMKIGMRDGLAWLID